MSKLLWIKEMGFLERFFKVRESGSTVRREIYGGVISWTILNCRKKGRVNWLLWLISFIFIAKYLYL
ncbi:MAG: hypothetical protein IJW17_07600 [Lentisphaeria bacterium]|nr:hypothetical protein [Lentisphaeria bacterium]